MHYETTEYGKVYVLWHCMYAVIHTMSHMIRTYHCSVLENVSCIICNPFQFVHLYAFQSEFV